MQTVGQVIPMVSFCGADGSVRPIRFQLEDELHALHTYRVEEIVDSREVRYVGTEAVRFLCRVCEEQRAHLMELSYQVRAHRWTLLRVVY